MLTAKLCSYIAQSQNLMQQYNKFGIATDKGSGVGGQGLQNSLIVTPDKHCVMAPPQAPIIFRGTFTYGKRVSCGCSFESSRGICFSTMGKFELASASIYPR